MNLKVSILFLVVAFFVFACGESAEEKAEKEREIKKLIMSMTNGVACVSISTTPDSLDKEVLVVIGILEDSSRIEALVKKDKDGNYIGREAFGSMLARDMSDNIGTRVTDLALEKADNLGNFKGKALLKSGEKIQFFANPEKGWYPINDLQVLQTITKYQIIKNLEKGQALDSIGIAPETETTYRGKYKLKSGVEQWIYVAHTGQGFSWNLSEAYTPPQNLQQKK